MTKIFQVSKKEINLPVFVVALGFLIVVYQIFSFLIPVTNDAFVVTNVTPIAADVSGYITHMYVKNGEKVKKDQPLVEVYREPYRLAYQYAKSKHERAIEQLHVIDKQTQRTATLLKAAAFEYEKARIEFQLKNAPKVRQAVPALEVKMLRYRMQAAEKKRDALKRQIAIEDQQIVAQKKEVDALKASMDNALINYQLTIVRAPTDGIVDNMYISEGTPIKIHKPIFSFVDTKKWWIQANFKETDLRLIRPGDEAYIVVRMYYFQKIFHGRVVNTIWPINRQNTSSRTQQQKVYNENEWLLIPQRLPLQIEILDPDPEYPLQPGASAYVYLKPHSHA